jgi:hypothetical protein
MINEHRSDEIATENRRKKGKPQPLIKTNSISYEYCSSNSN